jgi:hypothetical protein
MPLRPRRASSIAGSLWISPGYQRTRPDGWADPRPGPHGRELPFIGDARDGIRELPTPNTTYRQGNALAINELGHATGNVDSPTRAVALWRDGQLTVIGTDTAYALNNQDHVVGSAGNRAQLYRDGTQIDLDTGIPAGTGILLVSATGINGRGWIVANGEHARAKPRVFLLRPDGTA